MTKPKPQTVSIRMSGEPAPFRKQCPVCDVYRHISEFARIGRTHRRSAICRVCAPVGGGQ
jgi:hypothetical protein